MPETCWFCSEHKAATTRYSKPICEDCDSQEFRAIIPPKERTDDDKAMLWKMMITMSKIGEEARNRQEHADSEDGETV